MRISSTFTIGNKVQLGRFAGPDYNVADNQAVTTIGWGSTSVSVNNNVYYTYNHKIKFKKFKMTIYHPYLYISHNIKSVIKKNARNYTFKKYRLRRNKKTSKIITF